LAASRPESAIVNFYGVESTMGGHLDDAEPCQRAPIVSLSLGLDAIYLLGGASKAEPPRALRLRSGDVVLQGGASRGFYHGVPRVLAGTLPAALEQAAATEGQRDVVAWLRAHRMNINVRQVYELPADERRGEEQRAVGASSSEAQAAERTSG
jgi:alkylated DNA repair protein alkB family protein 1